MVVPSWGTRRDTGREGEGDCRGRLLGSLMAAGYMLSSWGHWPRRGRLYNAIIFKCQIEEMQQTIYGCVCLSGKGCRNVVTSSSEVRDFYLLSNQKC